LGRKTAFQICDKALNEVVDNDNDLQELMLEYISKGVVKRLKDYSKQDFKSAFAQGERIIEKSEKSGIKILSFYDQHFPLKLKEIDDAPILLSLKGDYKSLNSITGVAIIGTREPTIEGIKSGEFFGQMFGKDGFNIVSGLALGCDSAAHRGCLKGNGFTTAIVAHGLHTIYPKENVGLAEDIVSKGGVLLSEYLHGVGALPNYFVDRDRLQAGLSEATIVIQTAERGGTMHAVNATLKSKKILAVVKYKPELKSDKIRGNEMLINQRGAFPLTSSNLDELINLIKEKNPKNFNSVAPEILEKEDIQKGAELQEGRKDDKIKEETIVTQETELLEKDSEKESKKKENVQPDLPKTNTTAKKPRKGKKNQFKLDL
jgi:DNA processing protein